VPSWSDGEALRSKHSLSVVRRRIITEYGGHTMAAHSDRQLQEENQRLRRRLASLGVHSQERRADETVEEEYHRLREDLRWYLRIVKSL